MNRYKLVVADTTNPTYSKMSATVAQHLAVSFGYPLRNFQLRADQVLVFNPNTKEVNVRLRDEVGQYEATQAFTADYLVGALENPIVDTTTIEDAGGKVNATIYNNGVTFRSTTSRLVGHATVPKDFVLKVAKELTGDNKTDILPEVVFHYPDSQNRFSTLRRNVRLTKLDSDWLCGIEYGRGSTYNPKGTFKKYDRSKVEGLELLNFRP